MHQDQRIGLALGVLLVGACGAFFFRNDNRPVHYTPRLQHARELDERIAERSTRPYMKGVETIEEADRRRQATTDSADATTAQNALHSWNPLNLFQSENNVAQSERSRRNRDRFSETTDGWLVDDSLSVETTDESIADRQEEIDEAASPSSPGNRDSAVAANRTHADRTHVVQRGETLSSIAAKLFGDPNRFHEIFEANRDQLDDPNDVKLGMTLRLPGSAADIAAKPSVGRGQVSHDRSMTPIVTSIPATGHQNRPTLRVAKSDRIQSETVEAQTPAPQVPTPVDDNSRATGTDESPQLEESVAPKRFVPARRSPLPPRQVGPQSKIDGPSEHAGRRLSQISLESTSGKVAR